MGARLASGVVAAGLLRLAEQAGGFGTVLRKGDADAGSIILLLTERGKPMSTLERLLQPGGSYRWMEAPGVAKNPDEVDKFLEKRIRFDPDLWILELDTASAERFAAEMTAFD